MFFKEKCHQALPVKTRASRQNVRFQASMNQVLQDELTKAKKAAGEGKSYEMQQIADANASNGEMYDLYNDALKSMQKELLLQGKIQQETQMKRQDEEEASILTMEEEKKKLDTLETDENLSESRANLSEQKNKEALMKEKIRD